MPVDIYLYSSKLKTVELGVAKFGMTLRSAIDSGSKRSRTQLEIVYKCPFMPVASQHFIDIH